MNKSSLTKAVISWFAYKGIFAWRNNTMGVFDAKKNIYRKTVGGQRGAPDVIAIINGLFIGVECKIGRDKMSPEQISFKDRVFEAGGIYLECRDNIDRLEDYFGHHKNIL